MSDLELVKDDNGSKALILNNLDDEFLKMLYRKMTEKTRTQERNVIGTYIVKYNDLVSLNQKMKQICYSLGFVEGTTNITIKYKDNTESSFTSFDDFKTSYSDKPNQTMEIIYKFNLLKKMVISENGSTIEKMEDYGTTVIIRNLEVISNIEKIPLFLLSKADFFSIHLEVHYVDYPIASTIIANLDDWVETIEKEEDNRFLSKLQEIDQYFSSIGQSLFLIIPITVFLINFKYSLSNINLLKVLLIIFLFLFIFIKIGGFLGKKLEIYIDRIQTVSTIIFTTGDENYYKAIKKRKNKNIIKTFCNLLLSVLLNIGVSVITEIICNFF